MNKQETENYLDAIEWFDRKYEVEDTAKVVSDMYAYWPNATVLLANQGFFEAILGNN